MNNHVQGSMWKTTWIPMNKLFPLIVLALLIPSVKPKTSNICTDSCDIRIVESIPIGMDESTPKYMSTYDAWKLLIDSAESNIDLGTYYWTLRGVDSYNHSSAWQGEKIFDALMNAGSKRSIKIKIAQSSSTKDHPNYDTQLLQKQKAAEVRSVDFPRLAGDGVLHTKLWVVDDKHFYLGSANMDWRALTQVKELGVLATNCSCLAQDIKKIFDVYWYLGKDNSQIPDHWSDEFDTKINLKNMLQVNFNNLYDTNVYFSNAPPQLNPSGRTNELEAIVNTILYADKFVYISVMDYVPLTLYTFKKRFWPLIDDAIRKAAIENKVSVKMLISWWRYSRQEIDFYLKSLQSLSGNVTNIDIQIRRYKVPADEDQAKIPFSRVNHNKYMVTDNTAYIGTSNWSGDYFISTAGIGLIVRENNNVSNNKKTIRNELENIFLRDWNSEYAYDL